MKKYNITLKLSVVFLTLFFVACSEDAMDRINRDINNPVDVDSKFILTDIITRTAHSNMGGDINTYVSTYVEHEVGIHNQLFYAETRNNEPSASTTFNNVWVTLYSSLKEARIIIDKCSEGGNQEGNYPTRGMAEIMAAYNAAIITDMFGDIPYVEAARINEAGLPVYMTPKIDSQQSVYNYIFELLDQAIEDLQKTDGHISGSVGNNDLLYRGNTALWTKFAYGLKARYTMRLLDRSSNPTQDLEKIIEYVDLSFTSASEQAAFDLYDESNLNPFFDFQWSRDALAASESMADKLIKREDPRLRRVFIHADWFQVSGPEENDNQDDEIIFFMAPNGSPSQKQYHYNTSVFVYSYAAPTLLLSYHELLFLKAEALCRLNRANEAEAILKDAFVAAIANLENSIESAIDLGVDEITAAITSVEAGTYFDTVIKPLFDVNPLQETMIQKYLAFFGASGEATECYNDIRRMKAMGEDFIELANTRRFPLRLPYGTSDTTANPNVKEAYGDGQYVYTENVWWAGGSR